MAITTPTMTLHEPIDRDDNRWAVNDFVDLVLTSATAEIKAAPTGAGRALYLTHVTISIGKATGAVDIDDMAVTLRDEDGKVLYGPIQVERNGNGNIKKDFKHPLKLIDNKALHHYSVGGNASFKGAVLIYVEGFTGDKPLG